MNSTASRSSQTAVVDAPTEAEVLPALGAVLEAQTRGEIDIQIVTARRFPRSIKAFKQKALEMATLDEETAAACFYVLPARRGSDKPIEGPSARLAEIVASAWGHMRIEARVVGEDDRFVTSRGTAWDMENNVAIAFEVRRRITTSSGQRYGDDMIGVTANAASSIALRNAVFKVVPSAFTREIYLKCRAVAVGTAQTLGSKRAAMLEYFQKMGVPPARVFALLVVRGAEDITLDHLATLKGLATAIKEGETTVDESFAPQGSGAAGGDVDPLTQIMTETGADTDVAQRILARFDELQLKPADRLVRLKAHKGRGAELLAALAPVAAEDASAGPTIQVQPAGGSSATGGASPTPSLTLVPPPTGQAGGTGTPPPVTSNDIKFNF